MILLLLLLEFTALAITCTSGAFIEPELERLVRDEQQSYSLRRPIELLITMREGTRKVLTEFPEADIPRSSVQMGNHRTALRHALLLNAQASQASLIAALTDMFQESGTGTQLTSFWITNQLLVRNITANVIGLLNLLRDHDEVARVQQNARFSIHSHSHKQQLWPESTLNCKSQNGDRLEPGYNLQLLRVPELWAKGVNGTGVVVGIIDTGVRHTHSALRDSYKGDKYSWRDGVTFASNPSDDLGHGTMSMGLLVGGEGVGVAPGAKWIACKAVDASEMTWDAFIRCGQFMLCPTTPDGLEEDCSQAPSIVSGGLNAPPGFDGDGLLDSIAKALSAAGILGVSSAGAHGEVEEGCSSVLFPAHYPTVLAVGATDEEDRLWRLSGQGPPASDPHLIKPEVTAPGVNVISTAFDSDDCYSVGSGTDRAGPQVAGVVALLLSHAPWLTPAQVQTLLQNTAARNLGFEGRTCADLPDSEFPNFQFGYGRVDAYAAYECINDPVCLKESGITPEPSSTITQVTSTEIGDTDTETNMTVWLWVGVVAGGVIVLLLLASPMAFVFVYCKRKSNTNSKFKEDEATPMEHILRQFQAGVWPQLVALQQLRNHHDDNQSESRVEIANYVAFSQPYDFQRYDIQTSDLQIETSHVLGAGEFGIVYAGVLTKRINEEKRETQVGVKKLRPGHDVEAVSSFLKELQIMAYVGEHVNIVQLLGACTQSKHANVDELCMVLSLCVHGNLESYLRNNRAAFVGSEQKKPRLDFGSSTSNAHYVSFFPSDFPEATWSFCTEDLVRWTLQIASGMEYLAQKRVIHGDLAARNVLLDEARMVKLSDFGLASRLYEYTYRKPFDAHASDSEQRPLPWRWMSLESLRELKFSTASDVWAFGITAWEVFSLAEVPYPGLVYGHRFLQLLGQGYRNTRPKYGPDDVYAIMRLCWASKPSQRPNMAEIKEMLTHILEVVLSKANSTLDS